MKMKKANDVMNQAKKRNDLNIRVFEHNITGSSLSDKADIALNQVKNAEYEINKICRYLTELEEIARKFEKSLDSINKIYKNHFMRLSTIVERNQKTDWNLFTAEEKLLTENLVLLVNLQKVP